MGQVASRRFVALSMVVVLLSACQPANSPGSAAAPGQGQGQVAPSAPKVLTLAVLREFGSSFNDPLAMGETAGGPSHVSSLGSWPGGQL